MFASTHTHARKANIRTVHTQGNTWARTKTCTCKRSEMTAPFIVRRVREDVLRSCDKVNTTMRTRARGQKDKASACGMGVAGTTLAGLIFFMITLSPSLEYIPCTTGKTRNGAQAIESNLQLTHSQHCCVSKGAFCFSPGAATMMVQL